MASDSAANDKVESHVNLVAEYDVKNRQIRHGPFETCLGIRSRGVGLNRITFFLDCICVIGSLVWIILNDRYFFCQF